MRKLPTGELCAGEPHAQFGGRGGRESFPTPIIDQLLQVRWRPVKDRSVTKADASSRMQTRLLLSLSLATWPPRLLWKQKYPLE
jgi:hypothetical protein